MAEQPNGAGAPIGYMLPAAHDDYSLPPAPGEAPHGWEAPPVQAPGEHHTSVPSSSVPDTEQYVGGGIFAAETTGPADHGIEEDSTYGPPSRGATDFGPAPPPMDMGPGSMMLPPMGPMGSPMMHPMPMGAVKNEQAHMLGVSVIAVAIGCFFGARYGGPYGAISGSLFAGSAVNAYRAFSYFRDGNPEADKEAKVSGTYAVGAAAIGAVLWAKMVNKGARMTANRHRDDDDDSRYESNDDCAIRPVGP